MYMYVYVYIYIYICICIYIYIYIHVLLVALGLLQVLHLRGEVLVLILEVTLLRGGRREGLLHLALGLRRVLESIIVSIISGSMICIRMIISSSIMIVIMTIIINK